MLALGYGFWGLYQVDQQERGVVFRFGEVRDEVVLPGLHWNPPIIDRVERVNVTRVNDHEHQALMLTEDENIVDIGMTVQYVIDNPVDYLVKVKNPLVSIDHATESALRHVVGSSTMDLVITEGRAALGTEVQDRLQSYLNRYETGILVSTVNIDESGPPQQVQEAFDDVQKAKEDEARYVNEANAYAEEIVPKARGEAQRQIEEANAYRDQVIARAEGEAERFSKLLGGIRPGQGRDARPPVHRRHRIRPEPEHQGDGGRRGREQHAVSAAGPYRVAIVGPRRLGQRQRTPPVGRRRVERAARHQPPARFPIAG